MELTKTVLEIKGMTCGHCVSAVSTELNKIPTVMNVSVNLEQGEATVESSNELDANQLSEAIDEAGFELTRVS